MSLSSVMGEKIILNLKLDKLFHKLKKISWAKINFKVFSNRPSKKEHMILNFIGTQNQSIRKSLMKITN
jgi:hypothetical protein